MSRKQVLYRATIGRKAMNQNVAVSTAEQIHECPRAEQSLSGWAALRPSL